jgi:ADP-ribose pyrophosphatase YjhB (NUDIX family)
VDETTRQKKERAIWDKQASGYDTKVLKIYEQAYDLSIQEVLEETGVHVCVGRLIAVYNSSHILLEYPDGNRLQLVILHFAAKPVGGILSTSDETTEVGYFSRADIERMDVGGLDRQRIDDAWAAQAPAFVRDDFNLAKRDSSLRSE